MSMQGRDTVRRVLLHEGKFLVGFAGHDGYFRVTDSPGTAELREKISAAEKTGAEISFSYDAALNILSVG